MQTIIKIIPILLYLIVGIISLTMAYKNLFSKGFISFQEEAAGTALDKLDQGVRNVIIALMRTTGFGFLVAGLLLTVFPVITYFKPNPIIGLAVPFVCGIYCFGLFLAMYKLHKKSGVKTPWQGSLIAVALLAIGMIISIV
jgi:hypothetical protein